MHDLPALLGGSPVRPEGPPDWPRLDDAIRQALLAAFQDGSWGKYSGGHVERLEARLADLFDIEHVLTCASGTLAVEVALRAAGVGAGDEVVLAAYDYPGNFLSVHALGASPVLVDVTSHNHNLEPGSVASALTARTKALIVSHLHGGLVPIRELVESCRLHGVLVIEDAAQCPGASVEGLPTGTQGDLGILSFGGSKLLTAGRGGALLTRRADLAQRARLALSRGTNLLAPLSELQAAVLLPQVEHLAECNARRAESVAWLAEHLGEFPGLRCFSNSVAGQPGYYKVGLHHDELAFGLSRGRLVAAMRAEGVALDAGFRALHVGRSAKRWRAAGTLDRATRAHEATLILHHPVLLEGLEARQQIVQALRKIQAHARALG